MAYQSAVDYGSRFAKVGESVVLKIDDGVCAGLIDRVYVNNGVDDLHIHVVHLSNVKNTLTFQATATASDIENMANDRWTWPL